MADEFYDLFNQLFYSTDVWGYLGIALVVSFFFLVSYKVKEAFPFFVLIMIFMSVDYLDKMLATGYFAWHFVILAFSSIFMVVTGLDRFIHGKR